MAAVFRPRTLSPVAHHHPGAEEPDTGHDLRGDPGRIRGGAAEPVRRQQHEQGGADGDQSVGPQSGHPRPILASEPDDGAQADTRDEARRFSGEGGALGAGPMVCASRSSDVVPRHIDVVTGDIDGRRRLIQRWNGIGESPTDNHLIGRN